MLEETARMIYEAETARLIYEAQTELSWDEISPAERDYWLDEARLFHEMLGSPWPERVAEETRH